MKKPSKSFRFVVHWGTTLALAFLSSSATLVGQDGTAYSMRQRKDQLQARAEEEAEQLVALSADKIIVILQNEAGLLLQVKKLLVRKAFEQGRLLDPEDLNDDALFRLIRQDAGIRALITQEIENRSYVRAKPTREERAEMAQQQVMRARSEENETPPAAPSEPSRVKLSQEDAYWSKHDAEPQSTKPIPVPYQDRPSYGPIEPPAQENIPGSDFRRQVERTELQAPSGDFIENQGNSLGYPKVRPDELPELLNASVTDRSPSGMGSMTPRMGTNALPAFPGTMNAGAINGSPELQQRNPELTQQASMEARSIRRPAPVLQPSRDNHPYLHHRADPYADVPSLYDLYTQYSKRPPALERFGMDVFRNGTGNFDQLPMDMPVGPDYVLGPGDGLSIDLWGSVSERLQRVVDREGRVALPEVGTVEVNGRSLEDVQRVVQTALRSQFRDVRADVALARVRSLRVYVVGDVERPGPYDISSLSTPLNAVYTAGGPTSRGSLRILRHYRGKKLVQDIDVYELLLHGMGSGLERLQSGDTILVPPLGPEVTVEGMVRRPAIYELGDEKSLAEVLELAGGVLPTGTLRQIDVDRLQAHDHRSMLRLEIPENNGEAAVNNALDGFQVQDGDRIKISPILPYADKTVYLDGHVFRPGKFAFKEGMKITDVIHSYNELLPEPYKRHAEIIRLNPPDHEPIVLAFNLDDALSKNEQDLPLKPFDTIRIFGRYDFEDPPVITVTGAVRDPGDHVTNGATYLRDVVYLAGGTTVDAQLNDAQVFRHTDGGQLKVLSVDLGKALAGDASANLLLEPKDRVFIHKNMAKVDPPTVKIEGAVARPGKYPLGKEMTAADLVRLAGGLKRGAYTQEADLTRYIVEQSKTVAGEHISVPIGQALAAEPDTDVRLRDGDVLTIRELAGWQDVGATIKVEGEVLHPGTYGIREGERLSSIIARAGGFRGDAYPYGAIFERIKVRELEERNRSQLIQQVQDEGTALKSVPSEDASDKAVKEASLLQWKTVLESLQNTPPAGRLVIHISTDVKHWTNTPADIQVRAGDAIYIPKRPSSVTVDGAVYNPTAVTYKPGKNVGWYLKQAGGPSNMANKKAMFVIRADGSVVGSSGGMFSGGVESAALQAGDMVVVPQKAYSGSSRWKTILQVSQVTQAIAIAVQVGRTL